MIAFYICPGPYNWLATAGIKIRYVYVYVS